MKPTEKRQSNKWTAVRCGVTFNGNIHGIGALKADDIEKEQKKV